MVLPKKSALSLAQKHKYLQARAMLRAWTPKSKAAYERVYLKAIKHMLKSTQAQQREFFAEVPEQLKEGFRRGDFSQFEVRQKLLREAQSAEKLNFIRRFAINNALDAVGVSYTQADRRFRREVVKGFLKNNVSIDYVAGLYKRLGRLRTTIFISKLSRGINQVAKAGKDAPF